MANDTLLTAEDIDQLGDDSFHADDPLAIAAQLTDAAEHDRLADRDDAGYAYLLAAEIHDRHGDPGTALGLVERCLANIDRADEQARGWPRAFRAELLLQLDRADEALAELDELRPLLTVDESAPTYVAEALEQAGRADTAAEWMSDALDELLLAHRDELPDELIPVLFHLLITRRRVRNQLELPQDEYDSMAEELAAAAVADGADPDELLVETLASAAGDIDRDGLAQPVLLWWPAREHAAVGLRWPRLLADSGVESWQELREMRQQAIVAWGELGRPPLRQVNGSADGFAEFLTARGLDADDDALDLYTEQLVAHAPVLRLPPGRNENCWCGSGDKYKKCCLPRGRDRSAQQEPGQ